MPSRTGNKRKRVNSNLHFRVLLLLILITTIILALGPGMFQRVTSVPDGKLPIEGIDVSNHQGSIDWDHLDQSLVNFAFIKATESTGFTDKSFQRNWKESGQSGILRGAYHFYDVEADGAQQADHFISVVPKEGNTLPPVIDLETIGTDSEKVLSSLKAYVEKIEKHFGTKPIFYCNQETHSQYVKDHFQGYPVWFANYSGEPEVEWTFWQFTDSATVAGINTLVDFNQFHGDKEALLKLAK